LDSPGLPLALLASLEGVAGFDREQFQMTHHSGEQVVSVRVNPLKTSLNISRLANGKAYARVPWSSFGYYLSERPIFSFDPKFHAGTYYVQEASGMFLEEAIRQTVDLTKSIRVLDLCAAPGGKSTLIQSIITQDSLLVSNEVIKSRIGVLEENMIKWGGANGMISNSDPAIFGRTENYFDLILVDAPCSGSGLFRREPAAILEWSEENVRSCSLRQQRIIADAWPALKENGILIYCTCSYSEAENETIVDYILDHFQAESLQLSIREDWNIVRSISHLHRAYGFRFYPDKVKGEGLFISCLRKKEGAAFSFPKIQKNRFDVLSKSEKEMIKRFVSQDISLSFVKLNDLVFAIPEELVNDFSYLQKWLYLKKSGILLGKMGSKELIPHHELALSKLVHPGMQKISLSREDAIRYLRKDELRPDSASKGWTLVQYEGANLGWMKILDSRINNYYPVDWRIVKREA
jgi:16S rRNA C967 or C1407 C5-methylase (RsmB/RsmF family)/NOL1/NOP2/fmu family ribosome biogenesis protein